MRGGRQHRLADPAGLADGDSEAEAREDQGIVSLREVSVAVAVAVARAAQAEGLAGIRLEDPDRQVREAMWAPAYPGIEAI